MLIKTHLAITFAFILLFIDSVEYKLVFVVVAFIATYVPDIDSRYSTLGRKKINRILQLFTKHRGMIHSFTFLLSITFFLTLFWPVVAFGFFLGYSLHLFADSFTKEGIKPFYPNKIVSRGLVKTEGNLEITILVVFVVLDALLILQKLI
ncbi:MAG: metal-dependent hydrolase [archaeon]